MRAHAYTRLIDPSPLLLFFPPSRSTISSSPRVFSNRGRQLFSHHSDYNFSPSGECILLVGRARRASRATSIFSIPCSCSSVSADELDGRRGQAAPVSFSWQLPCLLGILKQKKKHERAALIAVYYFPFLGGGRLRKRAAVLCLCYRAWCLDGGENLLPGVFALCLTLYRGRARAVCTRGLACLDSREILTRARAGPGYNVALCVSVPVVWKSCRVWHGRWSSEEIVLGSRIHLLYLDCMLVVESERGVQQSFALSFVGLLSLL